MVARGDLGVEASVQKVPTYQKMVRFSRCCEFTHAKATAQLCPGFPAIAGSPSSPSHTPFP